jgi:transketolase
VLTLTNIDDLFQKAKSAKIRFAEMCVEKGKGHLSSGLSCAEIVTVLYYAIMRVDSRNPDWAERDRFVMSKNHASAILYPILHDMGYFDEVVLQSYQEDGSLLGTHSKIEVPGIDYGGGSLGIGLGVACGLAIASRAEKKNWLSFCLLGDGECHEGSVWESVMFAGHQRLNNLIAIVDVNGESSSDYLENLVELRPFKKKFEAFGWEVIEIEDGHCIEDLLCKFKNIRTRKSDKPLCFVANTVKGNGIPSMFKGKPWLHGNSPVGEDGKKSLEELSGNNCI